MRLPMVSLYVVEGACADAGPRGQILDRPAAQLAKLPHRVLGSRLPWDFAAISHASVYPTGMATSPLSYSTRMMETIRRAPDPTTQHVALGELASAGDTVAHLESELDQARRRRDALILSASAEGCSRRAVGAAARVDPSRVQQLVNAGPRSPLAIILSAGSKATVESAGRGSRRNGASGVLSAKQEQRRVTIEEGTAAVVNLLDETSDEGLSAEAVANTLHDASVRARSVAASLEKLADDVERKT